MKFSDIDIPDSQIVAETEHSFIFVNTRPFLKYHLLISPKRICKYLQELTEEETADLFNTARLCTKALSFYASDFSINLQNGEAAGQTVPHVHVHLLPRMENDLTFNNAIYTAGALEYNIDVESETRKNRSFEEMAEEATFLREKVLPFFKR